MERKASLAERRRLLETPSTNPDPSQADAGLAQQEDIISTAADAAGPHTGADAQPQRPKRRLPALLKAEMLPEEPSTSTQREIRPRVSIRARAAAAGLVSDTAAPSEAPSTVPAGVGTGTASAADTENGPAVRLKNLQAKPGPANIGGSQVSLVKRRLIPGTLRAVTATATATAEAAATEAAAAAAVSSAGGSLAQVQPAGTDADTLEPRAQQQQQHAGQQQQQGRRAAQQSRTQHDFLWDSQADLDSQHHQHKAQQTGLPQQQQQQQQVQEQELTLQQRQQLQLAQLGLKLPGAGAGDDNAWLQDVFAGAGSGGPKKGGKAGGASAGRRGGKAAVGLGSGGRSRAAAAAAAAAGGAGGMSGGIRAGGSGGTNCSGSRSAAAATRLLSCAAAGPQASGMDASVHQGAETGLPYGMQLAQALQEGPAAAAAGGMSVPGLAAGANAGVNHAPLVLFDPDSNLRLQVPGSINQHLRSYQRQGVEFLFSRYAAGGGGVLCDDMGLGKTVQVTTHSVGAISFIAALLGKQGTPQDALPRSFAAFRRQRQQERQQRTQLRDDRDDSDNDLLGHDAAAAGGGGGGDGDAEDAGSSVRWPVLVVCPTSVLDNWMRELNMWGTFKAVKYHGPPAVREVIASEASGGQYEVILASYDTLRVDAAALAELHPHAVIFDEAHKLKNPKSKQYEAAASLPTKYRYGLSGTIMQNDWDELYAVLDLLCPHCLGEYSGFVDYYSKPIKRGQSSTASEYEVVKGEKRRKQLVGVVQQVALRRTKAIIADQLPRKTDNVVFCQLQPLQYRAYDRTLASPDVQALRLAKSPCDCGSGLKSCDCCHSTVPAADGGVLWPHYHCCDCNVEGCKRHRPLGCQDYYESQGYNNPRLRCPYCLMLPAISLLTKISNHLELIRPDSKLEQQDKRQFDFELAVARMVLGPDADELGGLLANSTGWLGASDEIHCGKMATLKLLLDTWSSDYSSHNKVLLFSHSTRCLDLLEAFVQRQGYDYVRLDGSTPQKLRQGICDEFNSRRSIFLFLMSTVAGGLGLNLTAANKVVVFDPSWNPAHDIQAQDRAYRLGQTRDVAVYRLVGTGTLEEAVYKRQIYKQQQSNMVIDGVAEARYWEGVQGDAAKPGELWGLWNLLRFSGQTVETRDILQAHAYKGRQRQQVEQQLQHDLQQQRQQPGAQAGDGDNPAAAGATAAAAARPKPFKIIVLDQLVGPADADAGGVEELLFDDADPAAAAAAGGTKRRGKQAPVGRKRRGSEDSAGGDAAEGAVDDAVTQRVSVTAGPAPAAGAAADVGGIAASGDAWCDEALLQGLLDSLEPEDSSGQQQQQHAQALRKRQRRRAILSDDSDDERDNVSQAEQRGTAHGDGTGRELSPVAEGTAEGEAELQDSRGAGSDSDGPGVSAGSTGASGGSSEGYLHPAAAVDPVLAALEQQGAILHAHRHEQVLAKAKQGKAQGQSQHAQRRHGSRQQPQPEQRHPKLQLEYSAEPRPCQLSTPSSLPCSSVAAAYKQCPQAVADAAEAAAAEGWGPVASLAVWQGVGLSEMAEWLLRLSSEERRQVLAKYAECCTL